MQGFLLQKGKGQLRGSSSADQTWKIRSYFLFRYNLILVHIYGLCWVSETKLRTKAGAGGQSGKTISLVPEKSFLSSDCSACSDAVLPLKGKAGFQKQSISVRTDSKSLSLLARKHDDKKFNTVRFGTCLPVCWPTQVCTLPWFPRSSRQSLPCCLARNKNLWFLGTCLASYPQTRDFLCECCRRHAQTVAGQDCRASRRALRQFCQKVCGRLHHGKGSHAEKQLHEAMCTVQKSNFCFLVSYWAVGVVSFGKSKSRALFE